MATRRRRGEGSIYQDGDRWVGVVEITEGSGKRRRKKVTAKTHREVLARLRKLQATIDKGVIPDDATVEQWLAHWVEDIADVRPNTRASYRRTVKNYIVPHIGKVRLSRLTPDHVRRMQRDLADQGLAAGTIRHAKNNLQKALGVAVEDGRLERNVAQLTKAPTATPNPHEVLSLAEAAAVLKAAQDARTRCRLVVALVLGMRQGEALGLRWEDVTLTATGGVLRVRRAGQRVQGQGMVTGPLKTKSSRRTFDLPPLAVAAFAAWRDESGGQGYVFHGFKGPETIEGAERDHRAWEAALKAAGAPDVPLHGARGTAATLLQSQGASDRMIADILGHTRVTTSQQHYLHSDEAQRLEALTRLADHLLAP